MLNKIYFNKIIIVLTALCFTLNMIIVPAAFAGNIQALSETLDQPTEAADNGEAVNNNGNAANDNSSLSSCGDSIFSKIGGFVKNIFSGFKSFFTKSCGKQSFFGKLFDSILSIFGIFGKNTDCSSSDNSSDNAASNDSSNSSAAADNENSTDGAPANGTLANGETVQILDQSSGSYKIKKENGDVSWICKKKIRTRQTAGSEKSSTSTSSNSTSNSSSSASAASSGDTPHGTGRVISGVKATGYYPPPPGGYKTKAEAAMEGGALDCRGNKLRTLQNYKPGSYVSCATDPRVIKTGTYFTIDEFPGVKFLACDVGGAIKGNHIDICCNNAKETYKLPSKITIRYL